MPIFAPRLAAISAVAVAFASLPIVAASQETLAKTALPLPEPALSVCLSAPPEGLDPARSPSGSALPLLSHSLFDRLVTVADDGQTIEPALARWWEVSPDGLQYTFRLRNGVAFHETPYFEPTRPLAPDDVIFTFKRLIDPAHFLAPKPASGTSKDATGLGALINSIEKIADDKVRFTLKEVNSGFLMMLAMEFSAIQSAEYAAKALSARQTWMFDTHPIGTGPFKVAKIGDASSTGGTSSPAGPRRKPKFEILEKDGVQTIRAFASIPMLEEAPVREGLSTLAFAAHPENWRGRAASDELTVSVEADIAERYGHLVRGDCHIMPSPADADIASLKSNPDTRIIDADSADTLYLAFNSEEVPFDDPWVRRSLAEAVNFNVLPKLEGVKGTVATSILQTAEASFPGERRIYNLAVSRAHLAGAGATNPTVRFLVPESSTAGAPPLVEELADKWSQIGVKVKVAKKPWPEFLRALGAGDYDVALLAWRADSPDLAVNYRSLFSCEAVGSTNASRWCDPTFEQTLKAAREAKDPQMRQQALTKAAQKISADLPILSLLHLKQRWAVRNDVVGLDAKALAKAGLSKASVMRPTPPTEEEDIDPESGEVVGEGGAG